MQAKYIVLLVDIEQFLLRDICRARADIQMPLRFATTHTYLDVYLVIVLGLD